MQITIDGSKIDYSLENEKNMADVVKGVELWLASNSSILIGLKLDGSEYDPIDRKALEARDPEQIECMDVLTSPLENIEAENAEEVLTYISRYLGKIEARDPEIVSRDGFEGLHWVLTSIRLAAGLNMINLLAFPDSEQSLFNIFVRLEASLLKLRGMDDRARLDNFIQEVAPVVEELLPATAKFYQLIANRKNRDFNPVDRADRCAEEIDALLARIGELSTDLQTGNELKAMQAIQETTLHLENLFTFVSVAQSKHGVDTASIISDGQPLSEWIKRLSGIGSEIIEAFNNEDTVLLGDLFEYEIGEQLEKASGFIDALKKELVKQDA